MDGSDEQFLESVPEFLSIGSMFKAQPYTEGGERFVYFEASNQGLDQSNEIVAAKALKESSDYFLQYGNIDIDHYTMIGPKAGIPDYPMYEIGRPVDVRQRDDKTFVKAQIYSGEGAAARRANDFWSSLTDISPPQRWYPSVGGSVLEKSVEIDPKTKARTAIVTKVRWSNIGVSKTPVNQHVPSCATVPVGAFAKSLTADGSLNLTKALEIGYGTDVANLTGGSAIQKQSLFGAHEAHDYLSKRDAVSAAIRDGRIKKASAKSIAAYVRKKFGMTADEAAEFVEHLMGDISKDISRKQS